MELRILNGRDIAELLPMDACIDLMGRTMAAVSEGRAHFPPRAVTRAAPGGFMAWMPGALDDPACFGVKLLSLFPGNPAAGLSSHLGLVVLFEAEHGRPAALLDAAELTAIRTAAVSGLATRLLANPDAGDLAILGAGEQAASHLAAMRAARRVRRVRVWSRTEASARAFAAAQGAKQGLEIEVAPTARAAVDGADLVCTVTASREPVLAGDWIAAGAHLNVVGASRPDATEIDTAAVVRARYFVDCRASAELEAGDWLRALEAGVVRPDHIAAEIGEVANGTRPGRRSEAEITLFRSLGVAAEDLAAAQYVLEAARARGMGQTAEL
ncbi:MAG TPA: ornithine cyclodeaminase family protein [Caulobacteraceae bacterium]|nr:ornithine cyclodeaminase family protein [Caulobacteraceae bacterium]